MLHVVLTQIIRQQTRILRRSLAKWPHIEIRLLLAGMMNYVVPKLPEYE